MGVCIPFVDEIRGSLLINLRRKENGGAIFPFVAARRAQKKECGDKSAWTDAFLTEFVAYMRDT